MNLRIAATLLLAATAASAQNQTAPYTIRTQSRVVLTDITVTDEHGNPVRGIPQSAFHIYDNRQPQTTASFEEHGATTLPHFVPAAAAPGLHSNDYLQHLPSVLTIVVIDTTFRIQDQLYLRSRLDRFLDKLPEGQPLAVYMRNGNGVVLVQDFTADPALLRAAIHRTIPRFPPSTGTAHSHQPPLYQLALKLKDLPGRKNILWFTTASGEHLSPRPGDLSQSPGVRAIYDDLEHERIALYPVDAAGLSIVGGTGEPNAAFQNAALNYGQLSFGEIDGSFSMGDWPAHSEMLETARATGGEALIDNNALDGFAERILANGSSFYTLTYSPNNFRYNNKWHQVGIKLDLPGYYHISYRTGYFADAGDGQQPQRPKPLMKRILFGTERPRSEWDKELKPEPPIIFNAVALPASDPAVAALPPATEIIPAEPMKNNAVPWSIRYTLPADALSTTGTDGKRHFDFQLATMVLDRDGAPIDRQTHHVTMTLKAPTQTPIQNGATLNTAALNETTSQSQPQASTAAPIAPAPIAIDQQINLAKTGDYLYLAVWDPATGRVGSLQIPLQPKRP